MRENIKFRGKRLDNGEWVYGFLADEDYINDVNSIDLSSIEVDRETVGQYTGLKDRNGKEISMNKYDRIIAIDPDCEKSGVACLLLCGKPKLEYAGAMQFPELIEYLQAAKLRRNSEGLHCKVVVEAGWMVNKSNFHGLQGRRAEKIAKNVGANHETGRKIIEMCEHYEINVKAVHPLKKIWKGREGKITQGEIEQFIPDFPKRSNQDVRDAALLAWYYAGQPIRMNL